MGLKKKGWVSSQFNCQLLFLRKTNIFHHSAEMLSCVFSIVSHGTSKGCVLTGRDLIKLVISTDLSKTFSNGTGICFTVSTWRQFGTTTLVHVEG